MRSFWILRDWALLVDACARLRHGITLHRNATQRAILISCHSRNSLIIVIINTSQLKIFQYQKLIFLYHVVLYFLPPFFNHNFYTDVGDAIIYIYMLLLLYPIILQQYYFIFPINLERQMHLPSNDLDKEFMTAEKNVTQK